jgi:hypothetical protein
MVQQVHALWIYLRTRYLDSIIPDERGSVVETVIITAIFAALAIAIGAIIVAKVTAKANSIDLN